LGALGAYLLYEEEKEKEKEKEKTDKPGPV